MARKEWKWKRTQGNEKIDRIFEDLIRNNEFKRQLKKLRSLKKFIGSPKLKNTTWIDKHGNKRDEFDKITSHIYNEYLSLQKMFKRYVFKGYWKKKQEIAESYFLDNNHISYLEEVLNPNPKFEGTDFYKKHLYDELYMDMCQVYDAREEYVHPPNPGQESPILNPSHHIQLSAYPVVIAINPMATKRDVLDFVEKRWTWIESNMLRTYREKSNRARKRKYSQDLLDFIWQNRNSKNTDIKKLLDNKFPKNGIVYYEIGKIIDQEDERRNGYLM